MSFHCSEGATRRESIRQGVPMLVRARSSSAFSVRDGAEGILAIRVGLNEERHLILSAGVQDTAKVAPSFIQLVRGEIAKVVSGQHREIFQISVKIGNGTQNGVLTDSLFSVGVIDAVSGLVALTEVGFDRVNGGIEHQRYDPVAFSWTVCIEPKCETSRKSGLLLMFDLGWHLSDPHGRDALRVPGRPPEKHPGWKIRFGKSQIGSSAKNRSETLPLRPSPDQVEG